MCHMGNRVMKKNVIALMMSLVMVVGSVGSTSLFAHAAEASTEQVASEIVQEEETMDLETSEEDEEASEKEIVSDLREGEESDEQEPVSEDSEGENADTAMENSSSDEDTQRIEEQVQESEQSDDGNGSNDVQDDQKDTGASIDASDSDSEDEKKSDEAEDQSEETDESDNSVIIENEADTIVENAAVGNAVASGTCGRNVTWKLDGETMTISGTGPMTDYYHWYTNSTVPWNDYKDQITTVVINRGVTTVGGETFKGCTNLTSVTIPDSVVKINGYAFFNCSGLESIKIPDNVTAIGEDAFNNCTGLTNVMIPSGVTTIDNGAFSGCSKLTRITIPESVDYIGMSAFSSTNLESVIIPEGVDVIDIATFADCENLTQVTISENVEIICTNAFCGCKSLTSITIPDKVEHINDRAFEDCTGLKNVVIGNGVKVIDHDCFKGCIGLESVTIPNNVEEIGDYAFVDCTGLKSVTWGKAVKCIGQHAFSGCTGLLSVSIPDNVTSIGEYAFEGCTGLTSAKISNGLEEIEGYTFNKCSNLTNVTIGSAVKTIGEEAFNECTSLSSVLIPDSVTSIDGEAFANCTRLESVIFGKNVAQIGGEAFYKCDSLTNITIPDSVTDIGGGAFAHCKGLTRATIGDGVKRIGGSAFGSCDKLEDVIWGKSVENLGLYVFSDCISLKSITIPGSVKVVSSMAFDGCTGLKSVTIEDGVEKIEWQAFLNCTNLEKIIIGDGVTSINEFAFIYRYEVGPQTYIGTCLTNLKSVIIGNSVSDLNWISFTNCKCIESVLIGDSIKEIREGEFKNCTSLKSVIIGENVESIGNNAFSGCTGLTSLTIPDSVVNISDNAFSDCSGLKNVKIGESVESIGTNAFKGCTGLSGVTIPDNVIEIGSNAFYDCSGLESVKIGESVESIGNSVFKGCTSLTRLTIPDSVIEIGNNNFTSMTSLESVTIGDGLESIGDYAFKDCTGLKSVKIGEGVESIGRYAFNGCTSLTSITIPDSATSIGYSAFSGCTNLDNVTIGEGVESIGDFAFENCTGLTNVTIPNNVTDICFRAFSGCTGLMDVSLGESVEIIGSNAFDRCTSLTSIEIPNSVTIIDSYAFFRCTKLERVTIGESVTSIGSGAFSNCSKLESISISDSVESIGSNAFENCKNLKSITIPNSVTEIGQNAFYNSGITDYYYQSTEDNWKKINGSNNISSSKVHYGDDKILSLRIEPEEITLNVMESCTIEASCEGNHAILKLDNPVWTTEYDQSGGSVLKGTPYLRNGKAYCGITAIKEGTCTVTFRTNGCYSATVKINIVNNEKTVTAIAGQATHLNGSQNYNLEEKDAGIINLKDPIKSTVTLPSKSKYSAEGTITIKNNGRLEVNGTLNANKIVVKSGGWLDINGRVNAKEIIVDGGMLRVYNTLHTNDVTFKSGGKLMLFNGTQLIAENNFVYNGGTTSELVGDLYIGGSMDVNKNFIATTNSKGTLNTIFYGENSGSKFSFHQKSKIGNVFVKDQKSLDKINVPSDNLVAAIPYKKYTPSDTEKWKYSFDPKAEKLAIGWEGSLEVYYRELMDQTQTAVKVNPALIKGLNADEQKFVEKMAIMFVGTIRPQLNNGLLEFSTDKYELDFKLNGSDYRIVYCETTYGKYGRNGTIKFGPLGGNDIIIGGCAAGSQDAFKAQASLYLAESCVKQYYNLVTGSLPKGKTDNTLLGKIKKEGVKFAKKSFEKLLDKYLFSATKTIGYGDGLNWIPKSFELSNLILEGNVKGVWKYAINEAQNSSKSSSAKNGIITSEIIEETINVPIAEKIEEMIFDTAEEYAVDTAEESVSDTVEDEFLKKALIARLGADSNGEPDFSKQGDITFLDLRGKYIETLDGIQNFTNLTTLIVDDNEISSIAPLASMTSLEYLDISGQNIEDLSAISGLTNLVELDVSDNPLSSVDAVSGMTKLKKLEIADTSVSSLAQLASLVNLEYLDAENIELTDENLSALSNMNNLQEINLNGSNLASLQGINVAGLVSLYVGNNMIADMSPIIGASKLETLDISENAMETVPSLVNCTALKKLDLSGNMLMDTAGLSFAPSLSELDVSACELSDSDMDILAQIKTLTSLNIAYNNVDDMSALFALHRLKTMDISGTWVELADYSDLPKYVDYVDSNIIESGTCKDHKKWMVDSNGKLTIYGTGKMQSYENEEVAWPEAENVRIGEGITRVGDYAFAKQSSPISIQLPSTLKAIGTQAFKRCSNLEYLVIPVSVKEIGSKAIDSESIVIYYGGSEDEWNALAKDKGLVYKKVICNRVNLPDNITLSQTSYDYTGNACEPGVAIVDGEYTLVEGTDYTVTYLNNIKKGKATVKITGIGAYAGTVEKYFNIGIVTTPIDAAVIDNVSNKTYTGSEIVQAPVVTLNGVKLVENRDYKVSYSDNVKTGKATITITGAGDYTGTVTKTFLILPGKTTRGDMFNLANNVKVTWKEVSGAKYYKVYREGITDKKETQKDPVIVTDRLVGWDAQPGLTNGHAYRYKIVASVTGKGDSSGDSTLSYSKVMYRLKTVVIRSVKNTAPGKVTVKYDKTATGDSYVLQYCERQDMVGAKTKVVLGAKNTSYVIGGLKKGKTYYISIRVRKKVNGIDYYTTFGVPKKIKITK